MAKCKEKESNLFIIYCWFRESSSCTWQNRGFFRAVFTGIGLNSLIPSSYISPSSVFNLYSLFQLLWLHLPVVLCGVFALFSSFQVYHFVYPKATKSPESRDPTQYFCQAVYSPNLSLSTHLQLLPAVIKYHASLAVHSLLVFGQSVWSALRCILFHQVCAVTRCVLPVLRCTSSCSWIPGIALLHQLACLWYFVMVWLHQVSTYLPPHAHRHFTTSRPA